MDINNVNSKHILKRRDATSLKTLCYWNLKLHYSRCFSILNNHFEIRALAERQGNSDENINCVFKNIKKIQMDFF